ncbi:hypothetical protein HELRODRAFT_186075 [Helobdella robusta]|uniref:Beta-catenin-like protein 1 n=1 Tax=Helobdella robusta TaxID=6412 RepID=T1FNM8_HELRO|nr:hypothetical protein HELRODRAFT_186075 [Helobdella robusta]ESN93775.1 hypothetical protein HELRODRAFT_186075 [Helobdella robusta]
MDVSELLAFQPDKPSAGFVPSSPAPSSANLKRKRRLDDESVKSSNVILEKRSVVAPAVSSLLQPSSSSSLSTSAGHVAATASSSKTTNKISSTVNETREKVAKILEDDSTESDILDEGTVRRLIIQFEKRYQKNQEMRIKYPDAPEKFMESEIELNDTIQEMHMIASMPETYEIVIRGSTTIQTLLQLLNHENTDVSIAVVDLLKEMTDGDVMDDNEEEAEMLIDALLQGQILALLVQNLERLDETLKEEAQGIHNSLAILENMVELKPEVSLQAGQQGFLQWIVNKLKMKAPFDDIRLYCSEILSILLQMYQENRQILGEVDGIDVLLSQLSIFKKHDPSTPEEIEYMENLFNSLCSSLMLPTNRTRFLKGEGLQLMNLLLREKKKLCRTSAIKVLNHSMVGSEGVDNCNKFIDILGLRTIFPLFMKPPHVHKKAGPNKQELEEHIVSIVASLVQNSEGSQRQRLLNKFTENDHEKVDRLMELHFKYLQRAEAVEADIEKQREAIQSQGRSLTADDEDEFYMNKLEAGLFTLQLVDYIIVEACLLCPDTVRGRVMQILNLRGGTVQTIKNIMKEYASSIGSVDISASQKVLQERLFQLVDRF